MSIANAGFANVRPAFSIAIYILRRSEFLSTALGAVFFETETENFVADDGAYLIEISVPKTLFPADNVSISFAVRRYALGNIGKV